MIHSEPIETPTEPGWYVGRMKTWPANYEYVPVRVTKIYGTTLRVWQCADERAWWRARIWP